MKIYFALCALFLSACTTYRVLPDSDKLVWVNGKGYQAAENATVALSAAVDEQIRDTNIYYVEVTNKSSQPITVGPDLFILKNQDGVHRAIDPEAEIAFLTRQMQLNNLNANPSFGDALMNMPVGNETKQERHDREDRAAQMAQDRADSANRADRDGAKIGRWENSALRKNTIAPGQKITGFLKFHFAHEGGPLLLEMSTGSGAILSIGFHEVEK